MQSETLRFFRVAKQQPQKAIADVLNMSQPNYSDLESGKTKLRTEDAVKLAEYYGVNPQVFLPEKPLLINHNTGEHSKSINNTEQYFEADRELLQQILERVDKLFTHLSEEKKSIDSERKMLLDIFDKMANKLSGK